MFRETQHPMAEDPSMFDWSAGRCARCGGEGGSHKDPNCENKGKNLADRIVRMTGKGGRPKSPQDSAGEHIAEVVHPGERHADSGQKIRSELDANEQLSEGALRVSVERAIKKHRLLDSNVNLENLPLEVLQAISHEITTMENSLSVGLGDPKQLINDTGRQIFDIIAKSVSDAREAKKQQPQEQPPMDIAA